MKYVIIAFERTGPYAIGPFDSWDDANSYFCAANIPSAQIREVVEPNEAVVKLLTGD